MGKADLPEQEVFAKTVYAEARGESEEGQEWVAWVIKNRARLDKPYWGGNTIKNVCLHLGQFECWNGVENISIDDEETYKTIKSLTDKIYGQPDGKDPTGGTDHYNNPSKEDYPSWTKIWKRLGKIENHQFYKSLSL